MNFKIWDWKYRIFFNIDELNRLNTFKNSFDDYEKNIYTEIIQFYTSFYSVSILIDAISDDVSNLKFLIKKAKENMDKLIYTPSVVVKNIEKNISSLEIDDIDKNELNNILIMSTKINKNFDNMKIFEIIYGKEFLDSYGFLENRTVVVDVDHGDEISKIDIKSLFEELLFDIKSNEFIQQLFGESKVKDFDIRIDEGVGYAEWWDSELSSDEKDLLILYNNKDLLKYNDFKFTIIHEVYPGHGHFYNELKNKVNSFDHGAMSIIEGWATFCEWNTYKTNYATQIRNNAKCFLNESLMVNIETKANSIYERKIKQGFSSEEAIRTTLYTTQYIGFLESYYLGAFWIEYFCEKNKTNGQGFLNFLHGRNIGEFMGLWV